MPIDYVAVGVAIAAGGLALHQALSAHQRHQKAESRIRELERVVNLLNRRVELHGNDARLRVNKLEDIGRGQQGQLRFVAGRIQRIENFLQHTSQYNPIAPKRGRSEDISRIDLPESVTQTNLASTTAPEVSREDHPSSGLVSSASDGLPESCPLPLRITSATAAVSPRISPVSAHWTPTTTPAKDDLPTPDSPSVRTPAHPPAPPPSMATQGARGSRRIHPAAPPPAPPAPDRDVWSMVRSLS